MRRYSCSGLRNELIGIVVTIGFALIAAQTGCSPEQANKLLSGKKPRAERTAGLGGEMVLIPAGKFTMGLTPEHKLGLSRRYHIDQAFIAPTGNREVELPAFLIDRYEVTNSKYRKFVTANGHRLPLVWIDKGYPDGLDDLPITGVDFHDAQAYCQWVGKRLPTEEEWEKAARGTDARLWLWGNRWEPGACKMNQSGPNPLIPFPARVGSFPRDSSPYGVMDMAGNVTEWVTGEVPPPFQYTAWTKGGNFTYSEPQSFLLGARISQPQGNALDYLGFRCAKDAEGTERSEHAAAHEDKAAKKRTSPKGVETFVPAKPDASLYRSSKIQVLPVKDLDPERRHHNHMMVHPPRKVPGDQDKIRPWRLEFKVPYLPDDRFAALFEKYWNLHPNIVRSSFNADYTVFELEAVKPGLMELRMEVRGGLDYVDLDFYVKNIGEKDLPSSTETCFQNLGAPNFRDHEGSRTVLLTGLGIRSIRKFRKEKPRWLIWSSGSPGAENSSLDKTGKQAPLIAVISRDRQWLVAPVSMSGRPYRFVNNCEYSCIHSNPPSRVKPGETRHIKERIYFLRGSMEDLMLRWKRDLASH